MKRTNSIRSGHANGIGDFGGLAGDDSLDANEEVMAPMEQFRKNGNKLKRRSTLVAQSPF